MDCKAANRNILCRIPLRKDLSGWIPGPVNSLHIARTAHEPIALLRNTLGTDACVTEKTTVDAFLQDPLILEACGAQCMPLKLDCRGRYLVGKDEACTTLHN
jgi:hypothetical protein